MLSIPLALAVGLHACISGSLQPYRTRDGIQGLTQAKHVFFESLSQLPFQLVLQIKLYWISAFDLCLVATHYSSHATRPFVLPILALETVRVVL